MLSTELELEIIRNDQKIVGLKIKPLSEANAEAQHFCDTFPYRYYKQETRLFFHRRKLYVRHYDYKFNEMPVFDLSQADFDALKSYPSTDWSLQYSNGRTNVHNAPLIHLCLKDRLPAKSWLH